MKTEYAKESLAGMPKSDSLVISVLDSKQRGLDSNPHQGKDFEISVPLHPSQLLL